MAKNEKQDQRRYEYESLDDFVPCVERWIARGKRQIEIPRESYRKSPVTFGFQCVNLVMLGYPIVLILQHICHDYLLNFGSAGNSLIVIFLVVAIVLAQFFFEWKFLQWQALFKLGKALSFLLFAFLGLIYIYIYSGLIAGIPNSKSKAIVTPGEK